jgi:hypothetical protein
LIVVGAAAAVLCLVAASCSGDGRPTATHATDTSSTLPPSGSTAAGVDVESAPADDPGAVLPGVVPRKPGGGARSGASNSSASPAITSTTASHPEDRPTETHSAPGSTTTTTLPPGLPPEKCPDAKTCRRYGFGGNMSAANAPRWATGPDGLVTLRYHINPTGSGLPDDRVRGAAERAFATIASAAPTLRIEFAGFTSRVPTLGDGFTDIGFVNASTAHAIPQTRDGAIVEADMLLAASPGSWTWEPCEQRDGSCTPVCVMTASQTGCRHELQSAVTHEGLHFFWLGDMTDDTLDRELTMNPDPPHDRYRQTLALGDVLGLRALYPCSCPLPPIYAP